MDMSEEYQVIKEDASILCVANSYTQKYYLNPRFKALPAGIQEELQKLCVTLVEEAGGIAAMRFDAEGVLSLTSTAEETDYYYDQISAGLLIRRIERENEELFEGLNNYYRVKFLKLEPLDEE
jgi:hypothetical protein